MDGLLVKRISHKIDQRGRAKTPAAKAGNDRSQVGIIALCCCHRNLCNQKLPTCHNF